MRIYKKYYWLLLALIFILSLFSSYLFVHKYMILTELDEMVFQFNRFQKDAFEESLLKNKSKDIYFTSINSSKYNVLRLLPIDEGRSNDRIVEQMKFKPQVNNWKTILLLNGWSPKDDGNVRLSRDNCPVQSCTFIKDVARADIADAVLYEHRYMATQRKDQIWIFFRLEAPTGSVQHAHMHKKHITATYRRDSVIVTPYGKFVPFNEEHINAIASESEINYAEGKTELVAWFVSNCNTVNGRLDYATELKKYISVHIYGQCGNRECLRNNQSYCDQLLRQKYKFYLAFENHNCVDYITEKLFDRALSNDILPVVFGARRQDYEAVAPPHSFIHVDDFSSPKELAEYLHLLNKRDDLYNSYFKWKGTGTFINTKFFCRLCSMVHAYDNFSLTYNDINGWWNGKDVCVGIDKSRNETWATWKHKT